MEDIYAQYKGKARATLIAAMVINIAVGIQFMWSMLGKQMMSEYGFTAQQATLPYTLTAVVAALWALVAGRIGDFWKPKYGTMLSGLLMGSGLIIAGRTRSLAMIVIFAGAFFGMASTSSSSNTTPTAMKWFPLKQKGMVSGACNCFIAITSLVFSPLIYYLLGKYGTGTTFTIMGVAVLIFVLGFSQLLFTPPKELIDYAVIESSQMAEKDANKKIWYPNMLPKQVAKTADVWKLWGMYGLGMITGQILISQAANIISTETGMTNTSIIVMGMAFGQLCGRFIAPTLSDKLSTFKVYKIVYGIQIVNMLFFFFVYRSAAAMIVGAIIIGVCHGSCVPTMWAMITAIYGKKSMGSIFGIVTTIIALTGIVGPQSAARIFDTTGSYHWVFMMCACFSIGGLIIAMTQKPPREAADATGSQVTA